jgi:hypothetical protein
MPAGRPVLYKTDNELSDRIEEYFETSAYMGEGDNKVFVPTVSGLAYHLGMATETLRDYGTKDEFSATVKRAKQRIEMSLEQRLAGNTVAGTIFNLKNNFGWKDKTEQDINQVVETKDVSALDAIKQLIKNQSS